MTDKAGFNNTLGLGNNSGSGDGHMNPKTFLSRLKGVQISLINK